MMISSMVYIEAMIPDLQEYSIQLIIILTLPLPSISMLCTPELSQTEDITMILHYGELDVQFTELPVRKCPSRQKNCPLVKGVCIIREALLEVLLLSSRVLRRKTCSCRYFTIVFSLSWF